MCLMSVKGNTFTPESHNCYKCNHLANICRKTETELEGGFLSARALLKPRRRRKIIRQNAPCTFFSRGTLSCRPVCKKTLIYMDR